MAVFRLTAGHPETLYRICVSIMTKIAPATEERLSRVPSSSTRRHHQRHVSCAADDCLGAPDFPILGTRLTRESSGRPRLCVVKKSSGSGVGLELAAESVATVDDEIIDGESLVNHRSPLPAERDAIPDQFS